MHTGNPNHRGCGCGTCKSESEETFYALMQTTFSAHEQDKMSNQLRQAPVHMDSFSFEAEQMGFASPYFHEENTDYSEGWPEF